AGTKASASLVKSPAKTVEAPAKKAPAKKEPATRESSPAVNTRAAVKGTKVAAGKRKGDSGTKALADELVSLIPELDAEGLAFLIEQARVHLYNMRVVELDAAAVAAENASVRAGRVASAKRGASRTGHGTAAGVDDFTIQASSDGSTYDLVWQGKWKMFTSDEMLAMVRITSNKDTAAEVGGRLYRWFLAERSDVLQDIPFSGLADPKLKAIVALLRKTFTVKGKK
ncbi:MAG: hypothetical protein CVV51_12400, partial [Spirochaetae bacterium HGW-Spirochaetae-7]